MLRSALVSPDSSVDVPGVGSGGALVWRAGAASPLGERWSLAAPGERAWTGPPVRGEPAGLVTAVIRPVTVNTNVNELMLETGFRRTSRFNSESSVLTFSTSRCALSDSAGMLASGTVSLSDFFLEESSDDNSLSSTSIFP